MNLVRWSLVEIGHKYYLSDMLLLNRILNYRGSSVGGIFLSN